MLNTSGKLPNPHPSSPKIVTESATVNFTEGATVNFTEGATKSRLGATALYTAQVWQRNNLDPSFLVGHKGFWLYQALRPINWLARTLKGIDLETILVQRHLIIDAILEKEIEAGRIQQVIEIGAGFSPRGASFIQRYARTHQLKYIETDLPKQIFQKQKLVQAGALSNHAHHLFVPLDAFKDEPFERTLSKYFDPSLGTAIITEGLLNYFPTPRVQELWSRIHKLLSLFPHNLYLADTQTENESFDHPLAKVIVGLIRQKTKTPFYHHFADSEQLKLKLLDCGFSTANIVMPKMVKAQLRLPGTSEKDMVNIILARAKDKLEFMGVSQQGK